VMAGRAAMSALGFTPRAGDDFDPERIAATERLEKTLRQFAEETNHE